MMAEMQQIACPRFLNSCMPQNKMTSLLVVKKIGSKSKYSKLDSATHQLRPLSKLFKLSKSQFHHLYNRDDTTCAAGFFKGFNKIMSVKRFSSVGSYTHTELETKVRKLVMCLQNDISSFTVKTTKDISKKDIYKRHLQANKGIHC